MYLKSVRIENIKCFEDITLDFKAARKPDEDPQLNWNVILGDNGDGKTCLLQAIAACLMDVTTAQRVLEPEGWVRHREAYGRLTVKLQQQQGDLSPKTKKPDPFEGDYAVQYTIVNADRHVSKGKRIQEVIDISQSDDNSFDPVMKPFNISTIINPFSIRYSITDKSDNLEEELFDRQIAFRFSLLSDTYIFTREKEKGWISCGYGPFRRPSGISNQAAKVSDQLEERFLTLFDEGAALYKCEDWLKDLERLALKNGPTSPQQRAFETAKQLIVDILPGIDEIKLDETVQFWRNGHPVSLNQLSDGYRSMFALIVDLLRWLEMLRSDEKIPINEASGVVLIDEIDAHLHPKWQRQIGFLLTKTFPNLQFIVATLSPFVTMAAGKGALTALERDGDKVIADQEIPYIRDWAVDRVLTDILNVDEHSWETEQDLEAYETLRLQQRAGSLDPKGQKRLAELEHDLNRRLAGDNASPKQQKIEANLAYLRELLRQLQDLK